MAQFWPGAPRERWDVVTVYWNALSPPQLWPLPPALGSVKETTWPTEPEVFPSWPLTEEIYQPLIWFRPTLWWGQRGMATKNTTGQNIKKNNFHKASKSWQKSKESPDPKWGVHRSWNPHKWKAVGPSCPEAIWHREVWAAPAPASSLVSFGSSEFCIMCYITSPKYTFQALYKKIGE